MEEVLPGIYQLPLPHISQGHVNTYLIREGTEYLLVDTGWNTDESFDLLKNQMAEIGIDFRDISQIVITHIHPDHYGLAGRLRQLSQAKIAMHHLEKDHINSRYTDMRELLQQMEQWLHASGVSTDELPKIQTASVAVAKFVSPVPPDITLYGDETLFNGFSNFKVLWTPGHSPGHICLYEPTRKVLISGDTVLPTITTNVGLHPQSSNNPLGDYLNSLNTLKQLDVNLALPGHENPFTDLYSRIDTLARHHKQRNSEIRATIKTGPKTVYRISTEVTWMPKKGGISWQNLNPLDKRLAILETLAHLESMRADGDVEKISKDGIIYYQSS